MVIIIIKPPHLFLQTCFALSRMIGRKEKFDMNEGCLTRLSCIIRGWLEDTLTRDVWMFGESSMRERGESSIGDLQVFPAVALDPLEVVAEDP